MKFRTAVILLATVFCFAQAPGRGGQAAPAEPGAPAATPAPQVGAGVGGGQPDFNNDALSRRLDDLTWYFTMGDIADIDNVEIPGLPPRVIPNPTGQGAGNPVVFHCYTFIPKKLDRTKKHPLMVFVHGGVHSNFTRDTSPHLIRELVELGYTIIAPDYRGSTGYGGEFWRDIDYGGRENDDVMAARDWAVENFDFVDPKRVGIMGWSHGGMITLMTIFDHAEGFAVAYAGVPVSDLVARMGYKGPGYQQLYSAPYHLGKTAEQNVNEYRKRSPVWNAQKLNTPLLVHTNTADEDVNVLEVEELIRAFKAEGKKFEYKIYDKAPGGHHFNRLDTKLARDSRREVYEFLGRYLKP